jgi:Flp pilus assembly protein TadG
MMTTRTFRKLGTFLRDRRGSSAVEFALLMPVLTTALLPSYDLSMGYYAKMRVQDSAQAGALYAQLHSPPFVSAAITQAATAATGLSGVTANAQQKCGCPNWPLASPPTAGSITWLAATPPGCSASTCSDGSNAGTYAIIDTAFSYTTVVQYPSLARSFALSAESVVRIQ